MIQIGSKNEFQVDMYEGRTVEADQKARFANMFAGESGNEASYRLGEVHACCHYVRVMLLLDHENKV